MDLNFQAQCKVIHEKVKDDIVSIDDVNAQSGSSSESVAARLKQDKGAILMKLMGWKGGGIGKDQQGWLDPVEVLFSG